MDHAFEKLLTRPWISITEELPKGKRCVEFASHQSYGLANWDDEKGFYEGFVTCSRYEEAKHFYQYETWNDEVMYWREICMWPYNGTRGYDSELMKKYFRK